MNLEKIRIILMDVEGTTTSKDFVFKVLFPFAYEQLPSYLKAHQQEKNVTELLNKLSCSSFIPVTSEQGPIPTWL